MKVYVITREGIYRHEILGVFTSLEEAVEIAEKEIMVEKDGYHDIHINSCDTDELIQDVSQLLMFRQGDGTFSVEKYWGANGD